MHLTDLAHDVDVVADVNVQRADELGIAGADGIRVVGRLQDPETRRVCDVIVQDLDRMLVSAVSQLAHKLQLIEEKRVVLVCVAVVIDMLVVFQMYTNFS